MAFISLAHAQPSKIILHINGTTELVEQELDNSIHEDQPRTSVPVFSEQIDGTLIPGVYYKGISESGFHTKKFPDSIIQTDDGTWDIVWLYWSITHSPKNQILERKIHGSEYAQIVAAKTDTRQINQLGTPIILWTYDHDGAPIGLSETSVRKSVANAIDSYNELFKDDILLFTRFRIAWDNLGVTPVIAQSAVLQFDLSYSFVRTSILNTYAASSQDTDFFENGLYANFPTGGNIEYVAENGTPVQTSSILTTVPLATKFAGIGSQKELLITLNTDFHNSFTNFDPDPSDGISGKDLTGILVHELGHHFGFGSNLEGISTLSSLTVWDIYRMGDALGTISPNEFFG